VTLVLVAGGGTLPQNVAKAVAATGEVIDTSVGTGRDRSRWVAEQLRHAPVRLEPAAAHQVELHLGEDLGRLAGLVESLAAAYGEGATIGPAELSPFLGEAGSVPPWELTDAIDAGDTAAALSVLRRMLGAGGRPAPLVIASLHNHFSNLLRLDGAAVGTPEEAAALLGARSTFVAKKALAQSSRLGSARIAQAVGLLADADLDIKGVTALPHEVVLEVLVARLSRLTRARPAPARRR
jgi:DNA polymerase-3 subunit delta